MQIIFDCFALNNEHKIIKSDRMDTQAGPTFRVHICHRSFLNGFITLSHNYIYYIITVNDCKVYIKVTWRFFSRPCLYER